MASAGLMATVWATFPWKAGGVGPVLGGGSVGADITVEVAVGQHVVGVPLSSQLQLGIDLHVGGAASLVLNRVDIRNDAVVEPLVVCLCNGHRQHRARDQTS